MPSICSAPYVTSYRSKSYIPESYSWILRLNLIVATKQWQSVWIRRTARPLFNANILLSCDNKPLEEKKVFAKQRVKLGITYVERAIDFVEQILLPAGFIEAYQFGRSLSRFWWAQVMYQKCFAMFRVVFSASADFAHAGHCTPSMQNITYRTQAQLG